VDNTRGQYPHSQVRVWYTSTDKRNVLRLRKRWIDHQHEDGKTAQASMAYNPLLLLLYTTNKWCLTSSSREPDYANSCLLWPSRQMWRPMWNQKRKPCNGCEVWMIKWNGTQRSCKIINRISFRGPSEWLREQNIARDPQVERRYYKLCNRVCLNFTWKALTER